MGQFNLGDENNYSHLLNDIIDWKRNYAAPGINPTFVALVKGAQVVTSNGITLTFKEGAILHLITGTPNCIYVDNDLL